MNLQSFRRSNFQPALSKLDLKNKNVLVRVDFNCPVDKNRVTNNYRIRETLPTLRLLKKKGVKKITLVTHFGRPAGKYKREFSVKPVQKELERLWGVKVFCPPYQNNFNKYADSVSKSQVTSHKLQVSMWENVRFWPEEEKNNARFAKALTKNQDIFINESFSASHREHASITGTAKILPAYAGLRLAKEAREIFQLMTKKASPGIAVVGGAKIETKIPVLRSLAKYYDKIILGGKVAIEYDKMENGKWKNG